MPQITYLSLGSNLGDRAANLQEAIRRLGDIGKVRKVSSFYETEPVEFTEQPWFLNCAVDMETEKSAHELLREMLAIEQAMGRQRTQPKGPRLIDLDILLYGDEAIRDESLTVPHPSMHERRFVLEPLAEIAPEARHPLLKKSVSEMLEAVLPGSEQVRRVTIV